MGDFDLDRLVEAELKARGGDRAVYDKVLARNLIELDKRDKAPLAYFIERILSKEGDPFHIPDLSEVPPNTYFLTPGSPGRAEVIWGKFDRRQRKVDNARAFTLYPGSVLSKDEQDYIACLAMTSHMGGPSLKIAVREVIANMYKRHDVKLITDIRPGSSGATQHKAADGRVIKAGDIFYATFATLDPALAKTYGLPVDYKANTHPDLLDAMETAATRMEEEFGITVHKGGTYSKLDLGEGEMGLGVSRDAAVYHAKVKAVKAATGHIATEMEGAFLGTLADECKQYGITLRQGTMGYFVGEIKEDGHEESFISPKLTIQGLNNLMTFIKYTVQELHVIDAVRYHSSD